MNSCGKSTPPTPADGHPSGVPADRTVLRLARWLVIGLLGYEVLLPFGGLALAAGFDTSQPPAATADHRTDTTGPLGVILNGVLRITLPPNPARLREMPAPQRVRRSRPSSTHR